MITGLYIAILALAQICMIIWIVESRYKEKVVLGTGKSEILEIKTRIYGNFIETVPMALLLMLIAEINGASQFFIHAMGILIIVSRISHAKGLITPPGYGGFRKIGMMLMMLTYLIGAALGIFMFLS